MQLNNEVLPAPLGPTSPRIWPGSTVKVTACSTLMPPNCRLTSCKVNSAAIDCLPRRRRNAAVCGPEPGGATYGRRRGSSPTVPGTLRSRHLRDPSGFQPWPGDERSSPGHRCTSRSGLAGGTPAAVVGLPRHLGVGDGADDRPDLELLVRL